MRKLSTDFTDKEFSELFDKTYKRELDGEWNWYKYHYFKQSIIKVRKAYKHLINNNIQVDTPFVFSKELKVLDGEITFFGTGYYVSTKESKLKIKGKGIFNLIKAIKELND